MTGWSHGYNVSTGYTFGFYRETAPDWIDFALAWRGLVPPRKRGGDAFRYLELGCGQGFGLCLLAAANPEGEFLGIDFSPEHVSHAQSLAAELGLTNVHFLEGDFAELGADWPAGLGTFDYVVMHGIYSWVPASIRRSIIAILAAATNPGAAVYVSYNAMPGWVSTMPFQHMLRLFETEGVAKGIGAVEAGRTLFEQMEAAGSGVTQALPALKARIAGTRQKPAPYLVQEYLHENWHPMWCSKVMTEFEGAKLALAGTATLAEGLLGMLLPIGLQEVLKDKNEPKLREDITDCLINQTFRRDLYVRGTRARWAGEREWQDSFRFSRNNWSQLPEELTIPTSFGSLKLNGASVAPLFEAIGEESKSLAELAELPAAKADAQLLGKHLVLLVHAGWIACSRRDPTRRSSVASANARVAAHAAAGAPYHHVAAGALGSAIAASDCELMMLDAYLKDAKRFAEDGAAILQQNLASLGRKLAKDGKPLSGEAEAAEMKRLVEQFRSHTLPHWRRVGVID